MSKPFTLAAVVAVAVAVAIGGCGGGAPATSGGTSAGAAPPVDREAAMREHRGGTLRLLGHSPGDSLDPHVGYLAQQWQLFVPVYDGLVAFKKVGGEESTEVVPDLARNIPRPTDGGKRYVFRLRDGISFSDGTPVRPSDVAASLRRLFKVNGPTAFYYAAIVGADACLDAPRSCKLEGVAADDAAGTVTIRLTEPDGELLKKLALPGGSVLPADTPPTEQANRPIPGTGPYRMVSYEPSKRLELDRNPHFREWSVDAQPDGYPDEIVWDYGLGLEAQVTAIQNGEADWTHNTLPADRLAELGTRYASQVHISPSLQVVYVPLNVTIPPFDDERARAALNLAIDRAAVIDLFGGSRLAEPTCQVLPPGIAGYEPYCPWSKPPGRRWTAPDMERAKQLVQESGTAGQSVTVVTNDESSHKAIGTYLQSVLSDLGYDARVKTLAESIFTTYVQNSRNRVQASVQLWYQDYPSPSNYLQVLLSCASFVPNSDTSVNSSGFCDRRVDAQMESALALAGTDPQASARTWAKVDREVTDLAVWAPLFTPKRVDFVSSRVGNFVFSLQHNWLIGQSWVQ